MKNIKIIIFSLKKYQFYQKKMIICMKFQLTIEVPEERFLSYKNHVEEQKDVTSLALDFDSQKVIENLIKDMIEEMTSWEVQNCSLIER